MKNIRIFIGAFFIVSLVFSGCQQEEELKDMKIRKEFLALISDDDDTKTILDENESNKSRKVLWEVDDKILVSGSEDELSEFVYLGDEVSASGSFGGEISVSDSYYAYYPYAEGIAREESTFKITLPQAQSYENASFDSGIYPMVAKSGGHSLNFKALCGIFKFKLSGEEKIKSIMFEGFNADAELMPVSGEASVDMTYSSAPSLVMGAAATKSVTLDCGEEGVQLSSAATTFYLVLPPATYNSIKLTITTVDAKIMTLIGSKSLVINRSKARSTGFVSFEKDVYPTYDYIDEYGVNHGQGVSISNIVWAPVNCGYLAAGETHKGYPYGKLYQWGRKYGQGYDSDDASYPSGSNLVNNRVSSQEGNLESNKYKFYKHTNSPYDWCNPQVSVWASENNPCPDGWRVPTQAELEKLKKHYSAWTTNNGQNGRWFSGNRSFAAAGDAKVFLPAAGYRGYNGGADFRGSDGTYWSSSVSGTNAYRLRFDDGDVGMYDYNRAYGWSVRCVEDLSVQVSPVNIPTIFTQEVSDITGSGVTVKANIIADGGADVTARGVCWSTSAKPTISDSKTEDGSGVGEFSSSITGLDPETTFYVRAYATNSAGTAYGEERSFKTLEQDPTYDYIDEYGVNHGKGINVAGIIWAPVNCGYLAKGTTHNGYPWGKLYQWGRKYGQGYNSDDASYPSGSNLLNTQVSSELGNSQTNEYKYYYGEGQSNWCNDNSDATEWASENNPCPDGWRLPTKAELEKLKQNYSGWTTYNGQSGRWFSGKKIFLSAAGCRYSSDGKYYLRSSYCFYWSDEVGATNMAYNLNFNNNDMSINQDERGNGLSVRCVEDLTVAVDPTNVPTVLTQKIS